MKRIFEVLSHQGTGRGFVGGNSPFACHLKWVKYLRKSRWN